MSLMVKSLHIMNSKGGSKSMGPMPMRFGPGGPFFMGAYVMSLIFFPMSIGLMSHVNFKNRQCRPVEFKGQGPP